jgi:hypothetical protein
MSVTALQLGSGKHGDAMRLLAGAGSAANQIEYTTKYGSALPVFFTEEDSGAPAAAADEVKAVDREQRTQRADDVASSRF